MRPLLLGVAVFLWRIFHCVRLSASLIKIAHHHRVILSSLRLLRGVLFAYTVYPSLSYETLIKRYVTTKETIAATRNRSAKRRATSQNGAMAREHPISCCSVTLTRLRNVLTRFFKADRSEDTVTRGKQEKEGRKSKKKKEEKNKKEKKNEEKRRKWELTKNTKEKRSHNLHALHHRTHSGEPVCRRIN